MSIKNNGPASKPKDNFDSAKVLYRPGEKETLRPWPPQELDPQADASRTCPIGKAGTSTDANPICLTGGTLNIPEGATSPIQAPEAQADTELSGVVPGHAAETSKIEIGRTKAQAGTNRTGKKKGNPTPKASAHKGAAVVNLFDNFLNQDSGITDQEQGRKFVRPLTDFGNAQMFAHLHRNLIIYVPQIGQFIIWSNNAKQWLREEHGGRKQLGRLVKRFIYERYAEAKSKQALYTINQEPISNDDVLKWAKASSAKGRIQATLDLIKNMPGVCVSQADLDTEPCLLGVANGVLDLRTGKLIENSPSLFITRYCRAACDPKAKAEEFLKFIAAVCLDRPDLVDFLQEVVGVALSGLTKEQKFFILLGTGANAKSTLIEIIFHLLGDYAMGMPSHAFIKSESRAIRNDIARLLGVRFAPCAEINTGKALDESMVKRATGGDVMTARFIGKEFFDFHLVAKFFFSVNTLPKVTGADNGIYRRLTVIPFDADFSAAPDKELPEKLKAEIDGILTWAVKGFQRCYARGHLVLPTCVVEACKAYRAEMDTVQSFLDECCVTDDPNASTPIGVLFDAYRNWAKSSLVEAANLHLFGTLMGQKGFKKFKSGTWRWKGVALKASPTVVQPSLFGPVTDS